MACFDNFIEVDGSCSDVAPTSGLTLNSLGINLQFLDQIVTADFANGKALADAKIDFALKTVFNRVLTHFSSRIKPFSVLESARIGHTEDNTLVENGVAGTLKGIEVELCNHGSFVDFYLSDLSIHLTSSGAVDVFVYDLMQDRLLDTIPIVAVANQIVTVHPNIAYKSERKKMHLLIAYDSTGLNSVKTSVDHNKKSCCGPLFFRFNRFIHARGASILSASPKIDSNIDSKAFTGGVSLNFSLQCNMEDWLCRIRNMIALPVLYASGLEIINHALETAPNDRVNTTVTTNPDILEKRQDRFNSLFESSLENILKNIKLPDDKLCFICNERSRQAVILP